MSYVVIIGQQLANMYKCSDSRLDKELHETFYIFSTFVMHTISSHTSCLI